MSALSDALAAMECERVHLIEAAKRYMKAYGPGYSTTDTLPYDALVGVLSAVSTDPAPDMAAWIEKALPWVEIRAERLRTLLILARAEKDEAYAELIADASEELASLDALLAEAKGDNHAKH